MSTLYSIGQMNQLADALETAGYTPGDVTKMRSNQEALQQFRGVLAGAAEIVPSFSTFKTIKLGTLEDADAIRQAIASAGGHISDWANDILGRPAFTVATEETEVELVVASVAELGFEAGAKYSAICERAKQLGLELAPAEVGPQLRLQYADQPNGEWLRIAMEPITGSGGGLDVFYVEHDDDELWLDSVSGGPVSFWDGSDRFVFVRRK